MILKFTSGGRTVENAWGLVGNVEWSGDKQRAARTLSYDLAVSQADPNLPAVECPVGAMAGFWDDSGAQLFQGPVVTRTLSDTKPTVAVTAMDRGLYLAGNQGTLQVRGEAPETAVRRLCQSYGIPVGELTATGVSVSRKFSGTDLWRIIITLYTLASRQTGKQYLARFEWDRLTVRERSERGESLVIRPKSNLLTSTTTQSIEDMVNSVGIYDADGVRLTTVRDQSAVDLYGLLERHITQREGEDAQTEARRLLEDNGLAQKVTVSCLGDIRLTTGRTVIVRQPVTGLSGVFWIDADKHRWDKNGYTVQLTLNLRNVMYQTESGGDVT